VEEVWLMFISTLLLLLSSWASERHNDHCTLFKEDGCFTDWPRQRNSSQVTATLAVFLGWYLHCVMKNLIPGIGLHAGAVSTSTRE
jgi:hypothetical protein